MDIKYHIYTKGGMKIMNNPYEVFGFMEWWNTLSTSFISFYFILFVFMLVAIYYIIPLKKRWIVLLIGSLGFYSIAGVEALITVLLTSVIIWCAARCIANTDKEKKMQRKVYLFGAIIIVIGVLIFSKCYTLFKWNFGYIIPLGISYYTFSAVGYLVDVYWGKDEAEDNFLKLTLFLLFFSKILQGPISKHTNLGKQLSLGHEFDYKKFCYGIQCAIWGYFKKMVVADRIAIITNQIFGNYENYGGAILFLGMLLAAMQLYCDFSGCMDIAGGVSQMFGIELEQNFNHPFFSRSGAEFWQRWHMTLSGWFKDYLFLPVSRSKMVKNLSKVVGKKWGATARKNTIILISSFVVWMVTGLWHGSGLPYIVWGIYWYIVINSSTLLSKQYGIILKKLKINTECFGWKLFQMVRTYLIFSFGRILTIPNDLSVTGKIVARFFMKLNIWELFDGTIYNLGLTWKECRILVIGILLIWGVEILQTKYCIRDIIANRNICLRAIIYSFSVITILVFGIYGMGYDNSNFIYMNF